MVYTVTFESNRNLQCVNGVFSIWTSIDRAREAVRTYMNMYHEHLIDMHVQPNGIENYTTSSGNYYIEGVELNEV